jgi:hypothetical protein
MENKFLVKMALRTDKELFNIVTKQRNEYQFEAVVAAEQEIKNRNNWNEELSFKIEETINEVKFERTLTSKEKWKNARNGVFVFCLIHFIFEIMTGNNKSAALPVFINFFVSAWYIKDRISIGRESKNLFMLGIVVSSIVFIIRLVLGVVFIYLMTK